MDMKKLLIAMLVAPFIGAASASETLQLDRAPVNLGDRASLQRGAANFVNYCLNCHAAAAMRYARLEDLGLSEAQIRGNLMFVTDKLGETMTTTLDAKDAKKWFGVVPPDLSVTARARGSDWLFTYLRSFYRDSKTATGWNNLVFPQVGMPHVLHGLQGEQQLEVTERVDSHTGEKVESHRIVPGKPGTMTPLEYDIFVADLVNYLTFMGEPARAQRTQIGIVVLFFLAIFFVLSLLLKLEFWKDVK
jgi:ubiquinol-cytochrome c reductase cytochrome c1 subunit